LRGWRVKNAFADGRSGLHRRQAQPLAVVLVVHRELAGLHQVHRAVARVLLDHHLPLAHREGLQVRAQQLPLVRREVGMERIHRLVVGHGLDQAVHVEMKLGGQRGIHAATVFAYCRALQGRLPSITRDTAAREPVTHARMRAGQTV
jgi:hypothetical protein